MTGGDKPTGGGGGMGGAPQGPPTSFDCASLAEELPLQSPDPQVVPRLRPGTVLRLQPPEPGKRTVHAVTDDGSVAGSITGVVVAQLLRCMEEGHRYAAHVTLVNGGRCIVEVRPA